MRIAVIDSGVAIPHPHIGPIAGGVSIDENGESPDFSDRIGHGTAVMAAVMEKIDGEKIHGEKIPRGKVSSEKVPNVEYFAVRVFQTSLRTRIEFILAAIEWCLAQRIDVVNLSLGTTNPAHAERFIPFIEQFRDKVQLISAASTLPGSLPGVIAVHEDRDCPRDEYRRLGPQEFAASGYPRPIPGVPPERNLSGISFAVANMTGFFARDYDILCSSKSRD
jgi:Subtilase family